MLSAPRHDGRDRFSYASVAMTAISAIGERFDAATLARLARRTPEPLLRAATLPPVRSRFIAEVFRRMPSELKSTASAPDAVVRWEVTDDRGREVATWYLVFADGACTTTARPQDGAARTTLTLSALDLLRLASGTELPMAMFQNGRIKISGDLFFAAQLQGMFRIPA
jgi:putative sterol carrier protein